MLKSKDTLEINLVLPYKRYRFYLVLIKAKPEIHSRKLSISMKI